MNLNKLPGSKVQFEVVIPVETFKKALDEAFEKKAPNLEMDGFRKGHVPKEYYIRHEGERSLYPDALEIAVQDTYFEVVEQEKLKVCSQPKIDLDASKVSSSEPIHYFVTVEVIPEVTLGEYKGLEIEKEEVVVSDEEVQAEIDRQLKEDTMVSQKEGDDAVVENGDTAVIDYEGFLDGVAFEGGAAKGHELVIGSGSFIPGFEEQVIGMKKGETKDLNVTFPEEYHAENLKGKPVVFKVTVNDIKVNEVPEFNDEYVAGLDHAGIKTADEYRAHIKEHIFEHKDSHAREDAERALLEKVIENATFEMPEQLVLDERDYMYQDEEQAVQKQFGGLKMEQYLSFIGQTVEQHKESLLKEANFRIARDFVLSEIVKKEEIKATEEEIDKEYDDIAKYYGLSVDDVKNQLPKERVEDQVTMRKAYDFVKENNIFIPKK